MRTRTYASAGSTSPEYIEYGPNAIPSEDVAYCTLTLSSVPVSLTVK